MLTEALAIHSRASGYTHPATLATVANLRLLYEEQERFADAESIVRRALAAPLNDSGLADPRSLELISDLALLCIRQRRYAEADSILRQTLPVARDVCADEPYFLANLLGCRGVCLLSLGKHTEAEAALLEAHSLLEVSVGPQSGETRTVVTNLVRLYEFWGKADKAEAWRAKLAALPSAAGADE